MARESKKVIVNVTVDQAQEASASYAKSFISLKKIEARMNEEINKVKSKYQEDIIELEEQKLKHFEMLQVYANETKNDWGKRKSIELLHSSIGFRTGTPKVVKDKKFTWDGITEIVSKLFPNLVRVKSELDKDAMIALSKEDGFKEVKEKCYIDVVQEETFYVEVKAEELQPA